MDRIISLLAALVGLIALGGAILVHVNADTQHVQIAAEIAQLKATVGAAGPAPAEAANTELPQVRIPSAEHLNPSSSSEPAAAAAVANLSASSSVVLLPPLVASASEPPPASSSATSSSAPAAPPATDVAAQLAAMQSRIAELEKTNQDQASQLAATQAQLATRASSGPASAASSGDAAVATADATAADGGPAVHADATVPAKVLAADGPTKDCIPLGTRFMGAAGDSFPFCRTKMVLKVAAVTDGLATVSGAGDVVAGATVPYGNGCLLAVFSADTTGYAEMRVSCQ